MSGPTHFGKRGEALPSPATTPPNRTDQAQTLRGGVSAVELPGHVLRIEFHDRQIPLAMCLLRQLAKEASPGHTREVPEWRYDPATGSHRITMAEEPCRRALSDLISALSKMAADIGPDGSPATG